MPNELDDFVKKSEILGKGTHISYMSDYLKFLNKDKNGLLEETKIMRNTLDSNDKDRILNLDKDRYGICTGRLQYIAQHISFLINDRPIFIYKSVANNYIETINTSISAAIDFVDTFNSFFNLVRNNCIKEDKGQEKLEKIFKVISLGLLKANEKHARFSWYRNLMDEGIDINVLEKYKYTLLEQQKNISILEEEIYHQIPINQRILEEIKMRLVDSHFRDKDTKQAIYERMQLMELEIKKTREMAKDMTEQHRITEEMRIKYAREMMELEQQLKAQSDRDLYEKMEILKKMMGG